MLSAKQNGPMNRAAQALGRRGGRARAQRLSADERRAIAALGGRARSLSHHAARRIHENVRYLRAVEALRGGRRAVVKLSRFDEPLPGARRQDA
jgi:hypothetical protein